MPSVGFKYSALYYLNQWISKDRAYCEGLAAPTEAERLRTLAEAAVFYGIARNMPARYDRGKRLRRFEPLLRIVDDQNVSVVRRSVLPSIAAVRTRISEAYGSRDVLALTTKVLWLRVRSPIIIYDSLVRRALKSKPGDVDEYYSRWRMKFEECAGQIDAACASLSGVRDFCVAPDAISADEILKLSSEPWFRERVLDIYLWHQGFDT